MNSQIEKVSIEVLMENVSHGTLLAQGGFSALIKLHLTSKKEKYYLFDTGGVESAFTYNIAKLKIPLEKIEGIILSHGHWDHVGALKWVNTLFPSIPIYCHPDAIKKRTLLDKEGNEETIGMYSFFSKEEIDQINAWNFITQATEITPGMFLSGEIPRTNEVETLNGVLKKIKIENEEGISTSDLIKDDLSVFFTLVDNSVVVVTGCAHTGIINITHHATEICQSERVIGIVGGYHLVQASQEQLDFTVKNLKKYPITTLGACHCTGFEGKMTLYQSFPKTFKLTNVGTKFQFPKREGQEK
jgi:7,8-dihydropterin-6-yl-methyl-4-(beta-D-ribofuranosyl)aminobenzene 5'-phosphate synthase